MNRIIVNYPGHDYTISNLYSDGISGQRIRFVKRPPLHEAEPGILLQDLLRICIDRLRVLDDEKPWAGNTDSIQDLQTVIARQEARALIESVKKGKLKNIDWLDTSSANGHLDWERLR